MELQSRKGTASKSFGPRRKAVLTAVIIVMAMTGIIAAAGIFDLFKGGLKGPWSSSIPYGEPITYPADQLPVGLGGDDMPIELNAPALENYAIVFRPGHEQSTRKYVSFKPMGEIIEDFKGYFPRAGWMLVGELDNPTGGKILLAHSRYDRSAARLQVTLSEAELADEAAENLGTKRQTIVEVSLVRERPE